MVKVLVVEDEASIREMIALNLRLAGMEAVEADSAEAADRKSTRLNSSHASKSRMPSSA